MAEKIVDFANYCPTCKYWGKEGYEHPCNHCLGRPVNDDSRKPVDYKEDKKAKKKKGKIPE